MALNAYARAVTDRIFDPIARGLVRLGATANWMTFSGLVFVGAGAAAVVTERLVLGGVLIAVSGIVDALDGGVARVRGTQSQFGAFYDSTTDRVADMAVFGAIAWVMRDDALLFAITLIALGAAQVTSYMRAKAESLGWNATVGVVERAERLIAVIVGLVFPPLLPVVLWIVAIGGVITVGQRLRAVLQQAGTT